MNQSREPYMNRGTRQAIIFLFLLTLALAAANLLFTSALISRVNANKVTITQACEAGNRARQDQIALWSFVIQVSPPPAHETKAETAQRLHVLHRFALRLHQIFAPRDCTSPVR